MFSLARLLGFELTTAATTKVEAYNGFSEWVRFGNRGVITDNGPVEQEKTAKFNALLSSCLIFRNPGHRPGGARAARRGLESGARGPVQGLALPDREDHAVRRVLHPRARPGAGGVRAAPGRRLHRARRR
ncbi:Tn3 family transposase [Kitasatospora sp. NPDC127111]|uniref:Tn3 family transposase n=1 Tax=Kitasatospora sp. NPDC127111 TaxID=3345363 RepID=UPI00363B4AE6